ncbi:MAG: hypothetical protein HYX93_00585 [Chloroflexi bacterium]|nr:hypothetical protein [Chloroflexota bacterium]
MRTRYRIWLASATALLLAGCVGPIAGCFGSLAPPTPTRAPPPTLDPELARVRELSLSYWDTFNKYDLEGVLAYLEPWYREERQRAIRDEIRLVRLFHVKLGASIASEPEFTGPNEAEVYVWIREPTGTRKVLMQFRMGSEWRITFAEEVREME